jgi:two-component system, NarL family, nitrate/nitrite response regulator NarL
MAHLTTVSSQIKPRVLAADSTSMSTQLLVEALGREDQFVLIESPSDPRGILLLTKKEKPQVAVVSAHLDEPKRGSFDLVRKIRVESPETRVIVLLDVSERNTVTEAFRAGAQGVFCRTEPFRLLAKCIQCVAGGQVWANSSELQFLLQALAQPSFPSAMNLSGGLLSKRETDVVRCVAEGLTNREIAERLKLTEHTVKNYLFRIFDKLGVSSRVEVVLYAVRNGSAPHTEPTPSTSARRPSPSGSRVAETSGAITIRKPAI